VSVIIRSQNKKSIINFDRVDTIRLSRHEERGAIKEHYRTDILFYDTVNTFGVLGRYSTEEKAIKVLDMIQDAYTKSFQKVENNYVGEMYRVVFTMPQDSEV
jgi:hypothetical protein